MDNFWEVIDGVLDSIITPKKENSMFKVGDKVYCRVYGPGVVDDVSECCVRVRFITGKMCCYKQTGHTIDGSVERMLFFDDKYSTERPTTTIPADQVPVDTKVMVGGYKLYYAGDMSIFRNGLTSWSSSKSPYAPPYPIILAEPVGEYPAGTVVKP